MGFQGVEMAKGMGLCVGQGGLQQVLVKLLVRKADKGFMSRHMLSYMSKFTRILFHLVVLCDSLRCGAYGTYCYGIS